MASEEHKTSGGAPVSARLGIWAFLATELLLFGGMFTAYTVFRLNFPDLFHLQYQKLNRILGATNTVILLTSSLTMALGIAAIRRGHQKLMQVGVAATVLFGACFLVIKYVEWSEDFARGLFPRTDLFFGLYFVMTGLHGLHVIFGMAVMLWLLWRARQGAFSSEYSTPVEVTGLYWHFVDIIWIYLFPLFYLVG